MAYTPPLLRCLAPPLPAFLPFTRSALPVCPSQPFLAQWVGMATKGAVGPLPREAALAPHDGWVHADKISAGCASAGLL